MAPPTESGSGVKEECLVTKEKGRLAAEIMEVLDKNSVIWETISSKQLILHRIYAEQIVVSDLFTEYNLNWRGCDFSDSETTENLEKFLAIDEQVQSLSNTLDEFDKKADHVGDIIKGQIQEMKKHTNTLKQSLTIVSGATCVKEMENLAIPNVDSILNAQDANIEALAEEWDRLELKSKLNICLEEVKTLVQPAEQQ